MIIQGTRKQRNVIFDGNSLTNLDGAALTSGQRYPLTCYTSIVALAKKNAYLNFAVGGKRTDQLTSDFATKILPSLKSNDIVVFWEICNQAHDLTSDVDGDALYASVVEYCDQARNYGAKVVLLTGIARDFPAFDDADITDRIFACNTQIRANAASICDALADVALLTQFDAKADATNTTYYRADQTHLTNTGYDLIAGTVYTAIETLL